MLIVHSHKPKKRRVEIMQAHIPLDKCRDCPYNRSYSLEAGCHSVDNMTKEEKPRLIKNTNTIPKWCKYLEQDIKRKNREVREAIENLKFGKAGYQRDFLDEILKKLSGGQK